MADVIIHDLKRLAETIEQRGERAHRLRLPTATSIAAKIGNLTECDHDAQLDIYELAETVLCDHAPIVHNALDELMLKDASTTAKATSGKCQKLLNITEYLTADDHSKSTPEHGYNTWLLMLTGRLAKLNVYSPHELTTKWGVSYLVYLSMQDGGPMPSEDRIQSMVEDFKGCFAKKAPVDTIPLPSNVLPRTPSLLPMAFLRQAYDMDNDPPVSRSIPQLASIAKNYVFVRSRPGDGPKCTRGGRSATKATRGEQQLAVRGRGHGNESGLMDQLRELVASVQGPNRHEGRGLKISYNDRGRFGDNHDEDTPRGRLCRRDSSRYTGDSVSYGQRPQRPMLDDGDDRDSGGRDGADQFRPPRALGPRKGFVPLLGDDGAAVDDGAAEAERDRRGEDSRPTVKKECDDGEVSAQPVGKPTGAAGPPPLGSEESEDALVAAKLKSNKRKREEAKERAKAETLEKKKAGAKGTVTAKAKAGAKTVGRPRKDAGVPVAVKVEKGSPKAVHAKPLPAAEQKLATKFYKGDFSMFLDAKGDVKNYPNRGSWTSKAYKLVFKYTDNVELARAAYNAAMESHAKAHKPKLAMKAAKH